MIKRTFGAPLGGTTFGGQNGFESTALKLITPPNGGGGGGRYFPSMVVVELGDPGVPVVCWALTVGTAARTNRAGASIRIARRFILSSWKTAIMPHASAAKMPASQGAMKRCTQKFKKL
jgi:hypothetical protein